MASLVACEGAGALRQRLVLSLLSARPVRVTHIRSSDDDPGLRDYEASLLRLIEKVTNGTGVEISYTGTTLTFRPGVVVGGKVEHDCGTARAIGYFLEPMIQLAPFSKKPFVLTLTGITNDATDLSVDHFRTVTLPQLTKFGIESDLELKITKRGAPPDGGGMVMFRCAPVRALKPIDFVDEGRIKRIRGIAYSTRVSPQTANRLVDSARALLNQYIPDVFIYTDHYKGAESGKSPGFGVCLVAESTTGVLISTECTAQAGETPEDVGRMAAKQLLYEISKGGCTDVFNQAMHLLLMTLSPEDVSKIRFGKLTEPSIQYLRDLKTFFGITFKVSTDPSNQTVLLKCLGVGFTNVNKSIA